MAPFGRLRRYVEIFGPEGALHLVRAKLGQREISVTPAGVRAPITLRALSTDPDTYEQVFRHREYEFDAGEAPRVIVDAGANIGLASIWFATRYPEAIIYALEPEAGNFALLKRNVAAYPNVKPLHQALWRENGTIDLVDPGHGAWGFRTRDGREAGAAPVVHKVSATTVDQLMADHGLDQIDLLKVDIEGAEKEVFRDASAWVGRVMILVVELHEFVAIGCSRVFYAATGNFEIEWRKGENVYLARAGACPTPAGADDRRLVVGPPTSGCEDTSTSS